MADLIKNFQLNAATAAAKMSRPVHEDDPRDLVGLAAEMTLLRNGLVSWARELERFKAKAVVDFGSSAGGGGKLPLLDAGEYLEREVDEYQMMVRRCEGMLEQVSMTFQMVRSFPCVIYRAALIGVLIGRKLRASPVKRSTR